MHEVGRRVVALGVVAAGRLDLGHKSGVDIGRQFVHEMNDEAVFFLGVEDGNAATGRGECAGVTDLSAAFGVEGCGVEDDLVELLVFGFHLPVAKDAAFRFARVVAHEGGFAVVVYLHPIVGAEFARGSAPGLGGFHGRFESGFVDFNALFAGHQRRQIHREPEGVVQFKNDVAGENLGAFEFVQTRLEAFNALGEGAQEGFFLLQDDAFDELLLGVQFGECIAHLTGEGRNEGVHEGFVQVQEGVAVSDGAAEDAANDITRAGVGGELAVGDAEGHRADVVGDDAKGHVGFAIRSAVCLTAECRDTVKQRLEHVGIVVGLFALHGHRQALEAHPRVDVLVREGHEGAVGHAVELHEDEVPDFDHLRVVGVDEGGARCGGPVGVAAEVDVDFRARSAGPGFAHFPEVVLLRGEQDAVFGYPFGPNALGLLVRFQAVSGVPFKHGHVQAILVQAVHLG